LLTQPASRYSKPENFSIVEIPLPELRDDDILVKVKACGVCGTDLVRPRRITLVHLPRGLRTAVENPG
jgi:threonine dehydrogenase-like Zn-dependent dehydrogenase